jgi:hypothetical protein
MLTKLSGERSEVGVLTGSGFGGHFTRIVNTGESVTSGVKWPPYGGVYFQKVPHPQISKPPILSTTPKHYIVHHLKGPIIMANSLKYVLTQGRVCYGRACLVGLSLGHVSHRRASCGRVSRGCASCRRASHGRASCGCASYRHAFRGRASHGVHSIGVHLMACLS